MSDTFKTVMRTRVKMCGITDVDTALHAAKIGVDAIGLVFYKKSPRALNDLGLAREISQAVGPFVTVVALLVNPDKGSVDQILSKVKVNALQFHGDENEQFCAQFACPYFKAIRMKPELNIANAISCFPSASGILLDAYVKGLPGGTGESFDWGRVPKNPALPIVLAGGLTVENANLAIQGVHPYALDVSGGIESTPGVKDHHKMSAFMRSVNRENQDSG